MASSCKQTARVGAYHDGELPAEEARRMQDHVGVCAACAEELEQLRKLSRFLASAPMPQIAPDALERLHGGVGMVRESVIIRLAGALTAVAACVLAVCTIWLWRVSATSPGTYSDRSLAWENAARGRETEVVAVEDAQEQFARWIVEDLSGENGYE
jgi:anti-sigma factor RsiW